MAQRRVIIIGAAGRDFHNFNTRYRDRRGLRGRGLHRRPDPRHRRPPLPGGAGRPPLPAGHPHLRRGGPSPPHPGPRGRRVRLLLQRRLLHLRHAPRAPWCRPPGPPSPSSARGTPSWPPPSRWCRCAPCAPGAARARRPAGSSRSSWAAASRWWRCATPCPTATWRRRRCSASPRWTTWSGTTAPSRRWRSTSRTSCGATSSTPGWTTRPSCGPPRPDPDGCDVDRLGRREQRLLLLPARPGDHRGGPAPARATRSATTPARSTCAPPTWW